MILFKKWHVRFYFLLLSLLARELKIPVTIERIMLNNNAHQKPFTVNPLTIFAASKIIKALITKRNNPSVTTVMGSVKKIKTGFTILLSNASTRATMMAVTASSTFTPGNK